MAGFSAQPRAEERKQVGQADELRHHVLFQCSTTSRRAKTYNQFYAQFDVDTVSVLNHEPKSENKLWPMALQIQSKVSVLNHEPKSENAPLTSITSARKKFQCSTTSRRAKTQRHLRDAGGPSGFSAQPRAEERKPAERPTVWTASPVSVLNHEPKSENAEDHSSKVNCQSSFSAQPRAEERKRRRHNWASQLP